MEWREEQNHSLHSTRKLGRVRLPPGDLRSEWLVSPAGVVGGQIRHAKSARGVGGQTAAPGWVGGRTPSHGVVGQVICANPTAVS